MLTTLSIIWAGVTVILIGLSIHRSILVMREDDQIFLAKAEAAVQAQYVETLSRLKRLEFALKIFTVASGGLLLLIAALWTYRGLYG